MEQLLVRKAEPTDAAAVSALLVDLGLVSPADDMAERLRWFRSSGADHVLLAVSGASVVGLLALTVVPRLTADAPMVRVTTLAVPQGPELAWVERALLGEAETVARRHRCTGIELTRPGPNGAAPADRIEQLGYAVQDADEIRLFKALSPPEPIRI